MDLQFCTSCPQSAEGSERGDDNSGGDEDGDEGGDDDDDHDDDDQDHDDDDDSGREGLSDEQRRAAVLAMSPRSLRQMVAAMQRAK